MAIAPTGAAYKSLTFDNKTSREFGVYITGEAVYNAPEREVEMISIPGRNGAFALDKGRFENVTVTYPAGIFADNETDFAAAISDFRNYLCSRKGYCRLTDEYNPNEYRMAVYKSGLEVDPAQLRAGEFEITFDCKPQRWLTSGETKQTIANSGDTITNPTLFESRPLLEVEGYGVISIDNKSVKLNNVPLGQILISNGGELPFTPSYSNVNIGDNIFVNSIRLIIAVDLANFSYTAEYKGISFRGTTWTTGTGSLTGAITQKYTATGNIIIEINPDAANLGTANTICSITSKVYFDCIRRNTQADISGEYDMSLSIEISASGVISVGNLTFTPYQGYPSLANSSASGSVGEVYADSTKSALTDTSYIDLEIGEAYSIINNEFVSLNNIVEIPPTLPTLAPGSNTITYDNTITSLKVTPRWWKV